VLTDEQVLELIRLLPETWGNVVKISRIFGVCPWEISFIALATNDAGEPQLRVTKGKTYTTRGGVKEETEPRWLEAVAVDGTTFELEENWDQLTLPPTVSGKTLGNILRRLPYWQQLVAEYETRTAPCPGTGFGGCCFAIGVTETHPLGEQRFHPPEFCIVSQAWMALWRSILRKIGALTGVTSDETRIYLSTMSLGWSCPAITAFALPDLNLHF